MISICFGERDYIVAIIRRSLVHASAENLIQVMDALGIDVTECHDRERACLTVSCPHYTECVATVGGASERACDGSRSSSV